MVESTAPPESTEPPGYSEPSALRAQLEAVRREDFHAASSSLKWLVHPKGGPDSVEWCFDMTGVISMWLAEMDFPLADAVRAPLTFEHAAPLYGYAIPGRTEGEIAKVFAARAERLFGWAVQPERVRVLDNVLQGIALAIDRLTKPGDGVVLQLPGYPMFSKTIEGMQRRVVPNHLRVGPSGYEFDFDHLRRIPAEDAKILLLCSPHNPTGRVWTEAELKTLAAIAIEKKWLVLSDEVHAELLFPGEEHRVLEAVFPELQTRLITLASPSKTFNIAGNCCAVAVSGTQALQERLFANADHLIGRPSMISMQTTLAAWRCGDRWLTAVKALLAENRVTIREWARGFPALGYHEPEGTYFAWFDLRAVGLGATPQRAISERAMVALEPGSLFGAPGIGHARLVFATSPALLKVALRRMGDALETA